MHLIWNDAGNMWGQSLAGDAVGLDGSIRLAAADFSEISLGLWMSLPAPSFVFSRHRCDVAHNDT